MVKKFSWKFFILILLRDTELEREREGGRKALERNDCNSQSHSRLKLEARNSAVWSFQVRGKDPRTWAIVCCFPMVCISRKLNWKQSQESNPSTSAWDTGVPSGIFTAVPNTGPRKSYHFWWRKHQFTYSEAYQYPRILIDYKVLH